MAKRVRYTLLAISIIALIGLAVAGILTLRKGTRPDVITLRLKWLFHPGFAGEMVADRGGIFTDHGLTVTLEPGGFESNPITLVASGSDTFGKPLRNGLGLVFRLFCADWRGGAVAVLLISD